MRKPLHTDQSNGWEQERPTWPHHDTSAFVEAAGIRWHVQRMGQGPALLLVHGTGASTHSWRHVMPLLARRFSVIAIDLPGHAFTDPLSPARTSIEGISGALADLMVPPQQAVIVQRTAKQVTVRCLEGLGHLAHEERPALIADEVAAVCE